MLKFNIALFFFLFSKNIFAADYAIILSDSCTTDKYDRVGVSDVFGPSSHNWGEAFKRYGWDVSLFCGMHGDKSATSYFKGNLDSGFIDTLSTLMQDKALTSADNVFVLLNLHGKGTQQNHIVNVPLYYHIQKNSSTSTITNLSDIQKTVGIDSTAVEIEKNIYNGLVSEGWHEYRKFEVYLKTQKIIDLVELWKSQAGMVFLVSQSCFGGACVSLLSPDSEVCLNTITDLAYTIDGSYVDWLGYVLSGYRYASMDVNKKKVDEKITGQGFKSTRMKDLWAFGMRMTTNKESFQFVGYDLPALGDEDLLSAYYLMQRSGVPLTQSEHDIFRVFQASDEWESTKMLVHEQAQRHRLVGYVQEFALLLFSEYDNDSKREKIANFSLLQASAGLLLRVIDQNLLRSTLDHLTPNIDELIESAWNENPDLSKQKKTARVQLWLTQKIQDKYVWYQGEIGSKYVLNQAYSFNEEKSYLHAVSLLLEKSDSACGNFDFRRN